MKSTIVSILQHVYTVYVPTKIYAQELLKKKELPDYNIVQSPTHEHICIKPGINSFLPEEVLRLKMTRTFLGLVEKGSVTVNDPSAEDAYLTKLEPNFRNSKEYAAAKKQADLEAVNQVLQKECGELKTGMAELQKQMAAILKSMKNGKAANTPLDSDKKDDNSGNDKGKVS